MKTALAGRAAMRGVLASRRPFIALIPASRYYPRFHREELVHVRISG
jgi:hypothetical protein